MSLFKLFRDSARAWMQDRAMSLSAAIAYYSVFSLAPLLIVALTIAGALFGQEAAHGAIKRELEGSIGVTAARAVQDMIKGADNSSDTVLMAIVGGGVLLLSASGVFVELKAALNTIWNVEAPKHHNVWNFIKGRILSLTMVLVIGFLLLISLILSTVLTAASDWLARLMPVDPLVWQFVNLLLSMGVITVLFALIFKILPDAKVRWRDVWAGAVLTSALFSIGKLLLGLYLGRPEAATTYGAAGALVLILSWVYYSTNILLFGAEFTKTNVMAASRK